VSEIAASAHEQSGGISKITSAVAQMNKVTEQNAASSEESSSAAQGLSGQAAELTGLVRAFTLEAARPERALAGEGRPSPRARPALPPKAKEALKAAPRSRPALPPAQPKAKAARSGKNGGMDLKAEELIPLDGDPSFDEF